MITTQNLSHVYSAGTPFQKTALDRINLTIDEGEFVGVIGHTGSGKSTLIQHFNGLLRPTAGRILIDGNDIWSDSNKKNIRAVRFMVGLVFQYPEYQLFEETVFEDIAFGPKNMGLSTQTIHERVTQAMAFVGLDESYQKKSPWELSGGEKRRVAIAGVIAMRPKVLILDEPTAGLDPRGREHMLTQICEYQKQTSSTVLFVSHSMEEIARYTDKVLVMNHAEVFDFNTTACVFDRSKELGDIGLSVPQITRVCRRLQENGIDIAGNHYTVDAVKQEILRLLAQKEKQDA